MASNSDMEIVLSSDSENEECSHTCEKCGKSLCEEAARIEELEMWSKENLIDEIVVLETKINRLVVEKNRWENNYDVAIKMVAEYQNKE